MPVYMNSGKIVAGRDGTGRGGKSKVLQEVLADLIIDKKRCFKKMFASSNYLLVILCRRCCMCRCGGGGGGANLDVDGGCCAHLVMMLLRMRMVVVVVIGTILIPTKVVICIQLWAIMMV